MRHTRVGVVALSFFAILSGCGDPEDFAEELRSPLLDDDDIWAPSLHSHNAPDSMTDAETQRLYGQPFDPWAGDDAGVEFFMTLDHGQRVDFVPGTPAVNADTFTSTLAGSSVLLRAAHDYDACTLSTRYRTYAGYSGTQTVNVPADTSSGTTHESTRELRVDWSFYTLESGYSSSRENFGRMEYRVNDGPWTTLGSTTCESCPWWTSVSQVVPGVSGGDVVQVRAYYQMTLGSRFCRTTRKYVYIDINGVVATRDRYRDGQVDIPSGLDPGEHHVNLVVVDHDDDDPGTQALPHGAGTFNADALYAISPDMRFAVTDDDPDAPGVTLSVPPSGTGTVTLSAAANDTTSGVDSVAFLYYDGMVWTPIGTDGHDTPAGVTGAYSIVWNIPSDGTFAVRAVACDLDADRANDSSCALASGSLFACDTTTDCIFAGDACLSDGDNAPVCADDSTRIVCDAGELVALSCGTDFCNDTGDSLGGGTCTATDHSCAAGECQQRATSGSDLCTGGPDMPSVTYYACSGGNVCVGATTVRLDTCSDSGTPSGGGACTASDWTCHEGSLLVATSAGADSCGDPQVPQTTYYQCSVSDGSVADRCVPVPDTVPPTIVVNGPTGYIAGNGVITATAGDICDHRLVFAFTPPPDGQVDRGGASEATYVPEGFYLGVVAAARDDSHNIGSATAPDFAIDKTAPTVAFDADGDGNDDVPQAGVDPNDPSTWPVYPNSVDLTVATKALDSGIVSSGVITVDIELDPGEPTEEMLASGVYPTNGFLGAGPPMVDAECDHPSLCFAGKLDLGQLVIGAHRIEVSVSDVAGNLSLVSFYFRVEEVPLDFNVTPATLNLTSTGKYVTGHIGIPEGVDSISVSDIVPRTILITDAFGNTYPLEMGAPWNISADTLHFKIDRLDLTEKLLVGLGWSVGDGNETEVRLQVHGAFADNNGNLLGTFVGTKDLRVINHGNRP